MKRKREDDLTDALKEYDDEIATKTEWSMLGHQAKGHSNKEKSITHYLKEVDHNRIKFMPTTRSIIIALFTLFVGIACIISIYLNPQSLNLNQLIVYLTVLLLGFIILPAFLLYKPLSPRVFDKKIGMFWKAWTTPKRSSKNNDKESSVNLNDIHALQIIPTKSYRARELNLVLEDATRINVYGYYDIPQFYEEANKLAMFLKVPIWDISNINQR